MYYKQKDNTMEKFIKFLEDNNALENFENAFRNYNRDVKGYKKLCERDITAALVGAFPWVYMKEGYDYWSELNRKWKQERDH